LLRGSSTLPGQQPEYQRGGLVTEAVEVVCGGILVADHVCTPMEALPQPGNLVAVDEMYLLTGGCAANVACCVARQGIRVGVVGCVGDDLWGRFLSSDLQARGVDCSQVRTVPGSQTSQTMVLLCRGEDRRFVHSLGANRALHAADFVRDRLGQARVFYLGGYLVLPGLVPEEAAGLFRFCRERGIRTVLDVVVPTDFIYQGELEPLLPFTDYFVPNDDEAKRLTGEADPVRQVRSLAARGAGSVVLTMGGKGLIFAHGGQIQHAAPYQVEVLDQTGAGDAFAAGVIAGLVRGMDLRGALEYGSALGASCVRSIGCCEGVFTDSEAREWIAGNPLTLRGV
jgi:sugar/nucleoside kinase (ribokinase family)